MSQEVFQYNPILKKIYWTITVVTVLICLMVIRISLNRYGEVGLFRVLISSVLSLTVPFSVLYRLIFVIRPRIFSSYVVGEGKILYRFKNKLKEIHFGNIDQIYQTFLPPTLMGGFGVRLRSGEKFVFSSVLDNSHLIFEKIISVRPDLTRQDKGQVYLASAKRVKASWKRTLRRFKIWPLTIFKFLALPLVMGGFLYTKWGLIAGLSQFESFSILALLSFLFVSLSQFIVSYFEEYFIADYYAASTEQSGNLEKVIFFANQATVLLILSIIFYA